MDCGAVNSRFNKQGQRVSSAEFLPLILFVIVSTITPGGATTLATASGAHFGYRRSIPLMAGIAVGLASMAASAAAGLGSVLLALPSLQLAMKAIGSLYLLWLAWKIGRSGPPHLQANLAKPTSFLGGVWLLWHNPKGWAMTLGAAASFAALAGKLTRFNSVRCSGAHLVSPQSCLSRSGAPPDCCSLACSKRRCSGASSMSF
ncbi:threonine/homoserine/homoserine lactone efflux protein [Bradyrhizobium sp. LB9.1b]